MPRAVVLRHVHFEDLGAFAPVFTKMGYQIHYIDIGHDPLEGENAIVADLLVILGGPIGAYEENLYPFITHEVSLLRRRLTAGQPALGICLGAQLMAKALGADVRPGPAKEIGWAPVRLTDAGQTGPLRHLADIPVLHWHGDIFDLPADAKSLASTQWCSHQAFALDRHALGFQFHPEADGRGFERWLIGHAVEIAKTPGLTVPQLRRDAERFGPAAGAAGQQCIYEWLSNLL